MYRTYQTWHVDSDRTRTLYLQVAARRREGGVYSRRTQSELLTWPSFFLGAQLVVTVPRWWVTCTSPFFCRSRVVGWASRRMTKNETCRGHQSPHPTSRNKIYPYNHQRARQEHTPLVQSIPVAVSPCFLRFLFGAIQEEETTHIINHQDGDNCRSWQSPFPPFQCNWDWARNQFHDWSWSR